MHDSTAPSTWHSNLSAGAAATPTRAASATPVIPRETARTLMVLAILTGIAGDLLLRVEPFGLNLGLWLSLVGVVLVAAARRTQRQTDRVTLSLTGAAIAFALMNAWRDAGPLHLLNTIGALACLATAFLRVSSSVSPDQAKDNAELTGSAPRVGMPGIADLAAAAYRSAIATALMAIPLAIESRIGELVRERFGSGRAQSVVRGTLLAVPVLLLFGSLLRAADPVFAALIDRVIIIDLGSTWSHLLLGGFFTWTAAGFLRGATSPASRPIGVRSPLALGSIELMVVLGSLATLFLGFVVVQLQYFFGGTTHVALTAGLTYAEYARRGFFELVWVCALVIPLLLVAHESVADDAGAVRMFRIVSAVLLVLLAVIVASALQRMRLYTSAFGLTLARVYATAFMLGIALLLAWFTLTVLRGRAERFASGLIVLAAIGTVSLNAINPEALVVRVNVARAVAGDTLDTNYLAAGLGADAAPALAASLSALSTGARCRLSRTIFDDRWEAAEDWRSWNLARQRRRMLARVDEVRAMRAQFPEADPCAQSTPRSSGAA